MDAPSNRLDRRLYIAGWMTAVFALAMLAVPLHLLESAEAQAVIPIALWASGVAAGLVFCEFLFRRLVLRKRAPLDLASALFPPLRLMLRYRSEEGDELIWLPALGWRKVDDETRQEVARRIEIPMLAVVLLMLPLLGIELLPESLLVPGPELVQAVQWGTAVIWWAFTVEFLVQLGLSPARLQHCKKHWIELVVILLPLAAGLRLLRLGRLARMQQISKLSRAYRLRGALVKVQRAAVLLNLIQRLLRRTPEVELRHIREKIEQHQIELTRLRNEEQRLQQLCGMADDSQSLGQQAESSTPENSASLQRVWATSN